MDELSNSLNTCGKGCVRGSSSSSMHANHFIYEDDLVVFCHSSGGMQFLLKICSEFGRVFNIKYNFSKRNILIRNSKF